MEKIVNILGCRWLFLLLAWSIPSWGWAQFAVDMSGLPWQFTDREGDPLRLVPSTKESPAAPGTEQRVYYIESFTPLTSKIAPDDANQVVGGSNGTLSEDLLTNKTGLGRGTFKTKTRLRLIPLSQFNQAFISLDNPVAEGIRQDTFVSAHTGHSFFFIPMGRAKPGRIKPNPEGTDYIWDDVADSPNNKTKPDSNDYIIRIPRALPWDEGSDATPFKWAKNNMSTTESNVVLIDNGEVTLSKGYQTTLDANIAARQAKIAQKQTELTKTLQKLYPTVTNSQQQQKIEAAKAAFILQIENMSKERLFLDGFGIPDPTGSGKSDYDLTATEREARNNAWQTEQKKLKSEGKKALALQIELDSLLLAKNDGYYSTTKSPWLDVINLREMFSTLQPDTTGRTLVLYRGSRPLALEGATLLWGPTTIISAQPVYVMGSLMWNPTILPKSVKNMLPKVNGQSVADMENPFVLSAPTIFFVSADAIADVLRSPASKFKPAPGTTYEQPSPSEGDYEQVVNQAAGNKEAYEESLALMTSLGGVIAGQPDSLVPLAAKLKAAEEALDALTPSSTAEETEAATKAVEAAKAEIQAKLSLISSQLAAYGKQNWDEADKTSAYSAITSGIAESMSTAFAPLLAFSAAPETLTGAALEGALKITSGVSAYTTQLNNESKVVRLSLYEEKRVLDQLGANPETGVIPKSGLTGEAPFTANASAPWWQDTNESTEGIVVDFPVPKFFTTDVSKLHQTLSGYSKENLKKHRDTLVRSLLQPTTGDLGLPAND